MDNGETFMYHFNKSLEDSERVFKLISAVLSDESILNITFLINAKDYDNYIARGSLGKKAEAVARGLVPECYQLKLSYQKTYTDMERVKKLAMEYFYKNSPILFPRLQKYEDIEILIDYSVVTIRFSLPTDIYAFMQSNNYSQKLKQYLEQHIMESVEVELSPNVKTKNDYIITRKDLPSIASQSIKTIKVNVTDAVCGVVAKMPRYIKDVVKNESNLETVCGKVSRLDMRIAKTSGKKFFLFQLDDTTGSIPVKFFPRDDKAAEKFESKIQDGVEVAIEGSVQKDNYAKSMAMFLKRLCLCQIDWSTIDNDEHIQYREVPEKYFIVWPEAYYEMEQTSLFAEEMNLTPLLNTQYVVFDLETTGLNSAEDRIIEIGAVKVVNGVIKETFSTLVNPEMPIPPDATKVNNITNEMVATAPKIGEIIGDFYKFTRDSVLVAHNASFDIAFLSRQGKENFYLFDNEVLDTLALARGKLPSQRQHNLGALCKYFNIELVDAHRALNDTVATAKVMIKLLTL